MARQSDEKSVRWTGRAFHIEGAAWQKARHQLCIIIIIIIKIVINGLI